MNTINVQASYSNLTQVDKLQQNTHRTPVANQVQNAHITLSHMAERTEMPVQPDEADGKTIDPRDKKQNQQRRAKKRKPAQNPVSSDEELRKKTGHIVDFNA